VTRIVGGLAGGRRLAVPPGAGTRPTSDRAREGLFSTLESLGGLAGRRVLDLYAGSGAVGLEALSRGAAHCLLVEADASAARTLRANVALVGLVGAQVMPARVERVVAAAPDGEAYDVVFADPPYTLTDAELGAVLDDLARAGWLAPGAVLAVERSRRSPEPPWPADVESLRARRYGEGTLWYGRRP
jgi:16S rRNA (guanine966-N2)-methyltransferase